MKLSTPNKVLIVFLFCVCLLLLAADQPKPEPSSWMQLVQSEDVDDRGRAIRLAQREHRKRIDFLITFLEAPIKDGEDPLADTPRNVAGYILGDYRAEKAVPGLLKALEFQVEPHFTAGRLRLLKPAASALVKIGLPAVRPAVAKISQMGCSSTKETTRILKGLGLDNRPNRLRTERYLGDQCLRVLVAILGMERTGEVLQEAKKREKGEQARNNLQTALDLLRSAKFRDTGEALEPTSLPPIATQTG